MRLYRWLLRFYPLSFRSEYAAELCEIFEQRRRECSNPFTVFALYVSAFFDTLFNASMVHWDYLRQDLRYARRTFVRAPAFALTVIVIVGLGIGAATAVFSIADHVMIRALPFHDSSRLVKIWESPFSTGTNEASPPNYRDWKRMSSSFERMGAYVRKSMNLIGNYQPERLDGAGVSSEVFSILGVQPVLGRTFSRYDESAEALGTVILSHALWESYFGGDPAVLGRTVRLDNEQYTIIGVMPRSFYFPDKTSQLWIPLRISIEDSQDRTNHYFEVIARLKPTISIDQAKQEMRVIAARLERAYPKENEQTTVLVNRLQDELSQRSRLLLSALLGASICVLLIVCSNLANLLLARGKTREKEIALRASLGAGRERIVRQLLTENLFLSLIGGVLAVIAAKLSLPLLIKIVPATLPVEISLDFRVLLFALIMTLLTGVAFGLLPSLRASAVSTTGALQQGGQRSGVGGQKEKFRMALVISEVCISVVLLVSAGLLIRALWNLQSVKPGFDPQGVLTLRTALPIPKYNATARREQFYNRVLSEVRRLPGVRSAAYISFLPMVMRGGIWPVNVPGSIVDPNQPNDASLRYVTSDFFSTLRIPIYFGRDISETDARGSLPVAVVSQSFAAKYWPDQNPLGKRFDFAFQTRTVVGVVGDIRVRGLERKSEPQVYLSYKQVDDGSIISYTPKDLVLRVSGEPLSLVPAIRKIVLSADPEQPVSDVRTLEEIVQNDTASRRTQVQVLGVFAVLAILLASIGIHGVLSFSVSQRTQEIGVRLALGATPQEILGMILKQGIVLAGAGVLAGTTFAYIAGRGMQALLVGVTPGDLKTFAIAIFVSVAMTLAGSLIPALRAVRIDLASALRSE